jgi:hypothetical protein
MTLAEIQEKSPERPDKFAENAKLRNSRSHILIRDGSAGP